MKNSDFFQLDKYFWKHSLTFNQILREAMNKEVKVIMQPNLFKKMQGPAYRTTQGHGVSIKS